VTWNVVVSVEWMCEGVWGWKDAVMLTDVVRDEDVDAELLGKLVGYDLGIGLAAVSYRTKASLRIVRRAGSLHTCTHDTEPERIVEQHQRRLAIHDVPIFGLGMIPRHGIPVRRGFQHARRLAGEGVALEATGADGHEWHGGGTCRGL
jgi:hypothetical protein